MLLLLATWGWQVALFSGVGLVARGVFGWTRVDLPGVGWTFWLGWSASILLLELLNLLRPIDGYAVAGLSVIALAGWVLAYRRRDPEKPLLRLDGLRLAEGALWVLASLWIADQAIRRPLNGDAGLYHVQALLWARSHAIVPGIGNLNPQLALNQTHFLYAALVNAGPFKELSFHVTNGPVLIVALATSLRGLLATAFGARVRSHEILGALFVGPLCDQVVLRSSSPGPEASVFVVGFVIAHAFTALASSESGEHLSPAGLNAFVLVALTACTAKLPLAAFAIPAIVFLAWRARGLGRAGPQWVQAGAIAVAVLAPWMLRSMIMSGYPFYPSDLFGVPADWRMPREAVHAISEYIRAWGREPGQPPAVVLSSAEWVPHWFAQAWLLNLDFTIPVVITAVAGAVVGTRALLRRPLSAGARRLPTLIPIMMALAAWWLSSPDLRLAGAYLWVLAAQSVGVAVAAAGDALAKWTSLVLALAVGLGVALADRPLWIEAGRPEPLPPATREEFTTRSGLTVRVEGPLGCWDAPLPCALVADPDLSLRRRGDLSAGFKIDRRPGETGVDWRAVWAGRITPWTSPH